MLYFYIVGLFNSHVQYEWINGLILQVEICIQIECEFDLQHNIDQPIKSSICLLQNIVVVLKRNNFASLLVEMIGHDIKP